MYQHVLGWQSSLFVIITTCRKAAISINISEDLTSLMKTKCKDANVCQGCRREKDNDVTKNLTLRLCLGFGRKEKDDILADSIDFIKEDNSTLLLQCASPQHTLISPDSPFDRKKNAISTSKIASLDVILTPHVTYFTLSHRICPIHLKIEYCLIMI